MNSMLKIKHQDLAIAGAEPAFSGMLHVGRPNVGDPEAFFERARGAFDRRWFSNNGPLVQSFEQRAAEYLGVRHFIAVCNATVALEIASRALGMTGEVIVPSFTFVATAHCLQWQQITPVFADIDPRTHCLDPNRVEQMITPRTSGILGVHVWGQPCAIEELQDIARLRNLRLLFDASHAFGCSHRGVRLGNFGDAEVFSFHATKFFNTFEGGAIATNDDELAKKIRLMKNFGFSGYDNVIYIGTNGKMHEISAAMGLTSLDSIDSFISTNRDHYHLYREELKDLEGISLFAYDESQDNNYQYIAVTVDSDTAALSRDEIVRVLHAENVLARRYFYPGCHRMMPYRDYFPHAGLLLPETERLSNSVMILPTGTSVSADDIRAIVSIIRTALGNAEAVRTFLEEPAALPA